MALTLTVIIAKADSALRRFYARTSTLACVLTILFSGVASPVTASVQLINTDGIAPFEVTYDVGNNLINAGTANLSLSESNGNWNYTLETEPRGILKLAGKGHLLETSIFRLVTQETANERAVLIQPRTYLYRQDDERRRAVDASFNWDQRTITHTYRGVEKTERFDIPVIDRLSATLLIMNVLRQDFDKLILEVFDTGRIKRVEFSKDGVETLKTPLGEIETIRVVNQNADGGSRQTSTWFAPSLDYIPVKIEHRKRGELVARLTLKRLNNRMSSIELQPAGSGDRSDSQDAAESASTD